MQEQWSYASLKTIREVAYDPGAAESLLYSWRKKHNSDGDKTSMATIKEEFKKLRLENAELKMERGMLKNIWNKTCLIFMVYIFDFKGLKIYAICYSCQKVYNIKYSY